jgi:uncharacterized metal-binding protein
MGWVRPGKGKFILQVDKTKAKCPAGEKRGGENITAKKIPVLSCEGGCIRGDIARDIANIISKEKGYSRGCHGEFLTAPDSAIARWIQSAEKVVIIDGCFMKCGKRIFKNILNETQLQSFDALSYYHKYTEYFDPDEVPEEERRQVAADTAAKILSDIRNDINDSGKAEAKCS